MVFLLETIPHGTMLDKLLSFGLGVAVMGVALWWLAKLYVSERESKEAIFREALDGLHNLENLVKANESLTGSVEKSKEDLSAAIKELEKKIDDAVSNQKN